MNSRGFQYYEKLPKFLLFSCLLNLNDTTDCLWVQNKFLAAVCANEWTSWQAHGKPYTFFMNIIWKLSCKVSTCEHDNFQVKKNIMYIHSEPNSKETENSIWRLYTPISRYYWSPSRTPKWQYWQQCFKQKDSGLVKRSLNSASLRNLLGRVSLYQ